MRSRRQIALRYLRSWFAVDIIASIPIEFVIVLITSTSASVSLRTCVTAALVPVVV